MLAGGAATAAAVGGVLARPEAASAQTAPPPFYNVRDFGAAGDGSADDTAEIQQAIDAALANGGGCIWFPKGTYRVTTSIKLNNWTSSNEADFDKPVMLRGTGDASRILVANDVFTGNRVFDAKGKWGPKADLSAAAPAGALQVTVPSSLGDTLGVGSVLAIEENVAVGQRVYIDARPFELHKVLRVVGSTTVELAAPLIHSYNPTTAKVYKLTPVQGPAIQDLQFIATAPLARSSGVYALKVRGATNVVVKNVRITNGAGGFVLGNVIDGHVSDCTVDGLPNWVDARASYGYGVAVAGASTGISVVGLVGRGTRHLFTTLTDGRGAEEGAAPGEEGAWGGPHDITVVGGIGEGGVSRGGNDGPKAVWDTHEYGTNISFIGCSATGVTTVGHEGFQVRAKHVRIIDCVAKNNNAQGIKVKWQPGSDIVIQGGEITGNGVDISGNSGISGFPRDVGVPGGTLTVTGVNIHHNKGRGLLWGAGDRVHVTNCHIHDNRLEAIRDQGSNGTRASHVVIAGSIVPMGSGAWPQSTSVSEVYGSDVVIANNIFRGYGSAKDGTWRSGDATYPAIKQNNVVDP